MNHSDRVTAYRKAALESLSDRMELVTGGFYSPALADALPDDTTAPEHAGLTVPVTRRATREEREAVSEITERDYGSAASVALLRSELRRWAVRLDADEFAALHDEVMFGASVEG